MQYCLFFSFLTFFFVAFLRLLSHSLSIAILSDFSSLFPFSQNFHVWFLFYRFGQITCLCQSPYTGIWIETWVIWIETWVKLPRAYLEGQVHRSYVDQGVDFPETWERLKIDFWCLLGELDNYFYDLYWCALHLS